MPENYLLPQKGEDAIYGATHKKNFLRLLKKILLVAHFSEKKNIFDKVNLYFLFLFVTLQILKNYKRILLLKLFLLIIGKMMHF